MEPSPYFIRRTVAAEPVVQRIRPEPAFDDDAERIDLWAYWRTIRKHIRLIVAVLAGALVITALHVTMMTPIYTAETTVLIRPRQNEQSSDKQRWIGMPEDDAQNYYQTQCEVLRSRNLAAQVIQDLGLDRNPAFAGLNAKPGIVAATFASIVSTVEGWASTAPPASSAGSIAADSPAAMRRQQLVSNYLANLRVTPQEGTSLVRIAFASPNPDLAAQVVNAHAVAFIRQGIRLQNQANEEVGHFLQQRLVEIKDRLEHSEIALNDYRRKKGIVPGLTTLSGKDTVVLDRVADLSKDLTEAQVARMSLESQVGLINQQNYNSLPGVVDDLLIQHLTEELNHAEAESAGLASEFTSDYPPLAEVEAKQRAIRQRLDAEVARVVDGIRFRYKAAADKEQELQHEMDQQMARTMSLNDAAVQYTILRREVDTNRELYESVLKAMRDVGVAAEAQASNVSVIDTADPPRIPSSPKKTQDLALTGVLGIAAGIALAFLLEYLDNTLKTPEDVEAYLHVPNLGLVPEFSQANGKTYGPYQPYGPRIAAAKLPSGSDPLGRELVTSHGSYSHIGEAYRNFRTALLLSRAGAPPKLTLITSANPGEGKTVTAVNTAIMLAQFGTSVLLIDADLRRPRCHRVLAVDNMSGLTEVLTGTREVSELIRQTEVEHLWFLSSGSIPPNPAELLGSARMHQTLADLAREYDFIVVDSPPVMPVSDAMLLATMVDGVVVVANGMKTAKQQVKVACSRLEYAQAKILGVVLNRVQLNHPGYRSYYSSYYSSYQPTLNSEPEEESV